MPVIDHWPIVRVQLVREADPDGEPVARFVVPMGTPLVAVGDHILLDNGARWRTVQRAINYRTFVVGQIVEGTVAIVEYVVVPAEGVTVVPGEVPSQ